MDIIRLRQEVCEANLELVKRGLVTYTWGNVSGVNRERGLVAIKPSGVSYSELTPEKIVLVKIDIGETVTAGLRPSSDLPTHLELYRAFAGIGGVAHTHSSWATSFAQAVRAIPCLGTTHADYFYGDVPVTRKLSAEEIAADYETNTGKVIVELWKDSKTSVMTVPAALVAQHGPFTWGASAAKAVETAVVLEETAKMAFAVAVLNPAKQPIERELLDKHYLRKHGPGAYYGQK